MELTLEKPLPNMCKVTVLISPDEVNQAIKIASQKTDMNNTKDDSKKTLISIDNRHGISHEILEKIQANFISTAIEQAIEKFHLQPINRILSDGVNLAVNNQLELSLHFEVLPIISLPNELEALSVEVKEAFFENKAYQHFIQRLRRTKRKISEVKEKRLPKDGDLVFLELNGTHEGIPVLGMENNKIQLALTAQYQENQEFTDIARLLYVGTSGTIELPLPANHPSSNLHGKMININIKLIKIIEENLPEVNEAFAKSVGFSDVKQMQQSISEKVLNQNKAECQQEAEEKLLAKLIDSLDFPLPESLLIIHRKEYITQARNYYTQLGLTGDQLEQKLNESRLENEEMAQTQTRRQAYLMAVGYNEKLKVTQTDIEDEIKNLAQECGYDAAVLQEKIYNSSALFELQDRLLAEKAMHTLYAKAKKIIVDIHGIPVK